MQAAAQSVCCKESLRSPCGGGTTGVCEVLPFEGALLAESGWAAADRQPDAMSAAFTHMKQIGAGCGGTVKLARRKADNKLYALKELELPRDPQEAAAVLQETHILASLDHPFIVRYYDCFVESQKLFMVMEYAPNGTLANVIAAHQKSNRHVDEAKLWGYCVQLLVALHAIHKIGIIHRDVKPHNIFLGEGDVIKVCTRVAQHTAPCTRTLHAHRLWHRTHTARAPHARMSHGHDMYICTTRSGG